MEMFSVVYASRATKELSAEEIDCLLVSARTNNARLGISGVLLYGRKQFFQYFEGTREAIDEVYERIRHSSLHTDIVELESLPISRRLFNRWFMGFADAPESVLQRLSHEQWDRERPWLETRETVSDGMRRLLSFIDESTIRHDT